MGRDYILHKVRTALGRHVDQPPPPLPPVMLRVPDVPVETRIASLCARVEALAGTAYRASSPADALDYVKSVIGDAPAVSACDPYLTQCGITALANVRDGVTNRQELRELCATVRFGITSADYCLGDTGTLVMLASRDEARLISLLPPVHIAVVPRERILTGLDELLTLVPLPAEGTSSMVLITGPSRTGDIEQFLVRGVHGPGEIHVVIV
ncbi:MAG: lactate utilization protein [Bryobacteraceae bacterium]